MKYRRLGSSGCKVSAIGLGTWLTFGTRLHDRVSSGLVRVALDKGINFIDTADVYDGGKAEEQLGRVLADVPRKDVVLASKVFFPTGDGPNDRGLSRKHIRETVHGSLRRLKTDYMDLLQCHRYDEETPVAETVRAMDDLVREGKILYWGVSMWTAAQVEEAAAAARDLNAVPPVSNQPVYNLLDRGIEADVLPACRRHGLGIIPFSPLAQGVLTGKYLKGAQPRDSRLLDERRNQFMKRYMDEPQMERVGRMAELARSHGITTAQLALAWLLHRPEVSSVIVGATKSPQLEENALAADVVLDHDTARQLDELFPA